MNGQLARLLRTPDLDMRDAKSRSGTNGPATFMRGSRQIDVAWVTLDIEIGPACFLLFFFGVGDHRGIPLDIPQQSLIGGKIHKNARINARRLQCDKHEIQKNTIMTLNYTAQNIVDNKRLILCSHQFIQQ